MAGLRKAVFALFLLVLLVSRVHAQLGIVPTITDQPVDTNVLTGGTVSFQVGAYSLTTMSYKWYHNGVVITGATDSTYMITNAQPSDAGGYYVEVRNLVGAVNSSTATLTVSTVFQTAWGFQSKQIIDRGFQLNVSGPPLSTYTLFATPDLVNWPAVFTNYSDDGNLTLIDSYAFARQMCVYRLTTSRIISVLEQNTSTGKKFEVKLNQKGAQSFRHGAAGDPSYNITKIVLRVSRPTTAPNRPFNVSFGTGTNSGTLSNSLVAFDTATTITNTSGGSTYQTLEVVYPMPVGPLTAGTTYFLNLDCEAPNGRQVFVQGSDNQYANGAYYQAKTVTSTDARFELWGQSYPATATSTSAPSPIILSFSIGPISIGL